MLRAKPLLDQATKDYTGDENPLEMIRRLATSKITTEAPQYPMLVPRDDSAAPVAQNPTNPPTLIARDTPSDPARPTDPPKLRLVPRDSPYGSAPDMSRVPDDVATAEFSRLMPRPDAPISTTTDPGLTPELTPRPTQPLIREALPPSHSVTGLVYDEHGRPLKPGFIDPSSDRALQTREQYIQALEQYKPENHNSRVVSGLITAGRGALAGLREGPGGALGGGLAGLGIGLADPTSDEKYAKRRDLAVAQGELSHDLDFRKHTSDLATAEAERQLKTAQAIKDLQPTTYKPDVIPDNQGYLQSIDTTSGVAKPVTDAKGNPIKGKQNSTHQWRNDPFTGKAELWQITPGEADKKIPGAVDAKQDLIKTDHGWVKPDVAVMADATAENRNWIRDHTLQTDAERRQNRQEDLGFRRGDKEDARREKAAGLATELEAANAESVKWAGMAKATDDPDHRAYYNAQAQAEKDRAFAKAKEINEGYGDIYEAGPGDGGWPYAKPKPAKPVLVPRTTAPPKLKSDPLGLFNQNQ